MGTSDFVAIQDSAHKHTKKYTAVSSTMRVLLNPDHHVFHVSHMSDCERPLKSLGGDTKTAVDKWCNIPSPLLSDRWYSLEKTTSLTSFQTICLV